MIRRLVASLFLVLVVWLMFPAQSFAGTAATDCVEPKESAVANLINDYRQAHGLNRLALSDTLSASAEHWVQQMSHHDWFGHFAPDGTTWADNQRAHGYDFNTLRGQNIGAVVETPQKIFDAWIQSDSHRDNILDAGFVAFGVGHTYYAGSTYGHYWTVDFGGFRDAPADFC